MDFRVLNSINQYAFIIYIVHHSNCPLYICEIMYCLKGLKTPIKQTKQTYCTFFACEERVNWSKVMYNFVYPCQWGYWTSNGCKIYYCFSNSSKLENVTFTRNLNTNYSENCQSHWNTNLEAWNRKTVNESFNEHVIHSIYVMLNDDTVLYQWNKTHITHIVSDIGMPELLFYEFNKSDLLSDIV